MSADAEVRVQAIVSWLEHGRITTAQAARRIAAIAFPAKPEMSVYAQQHADVHGDPRPPEPGSFFPVSDAYAQGRIDEAQYAALAHAAAGTPGGVSGT